MYSAHPVFWWQEMKDKCAQYMNKYGRWMNPKGDVREARIKQQLSLHSMFKSAYLYPTCAPPVIVESSGAQVEGVTQVNLG